MPNFIESLSDIEICTTVQYFLSSSGWLILVVIMCICCMAECYYLNRNWSRNNFTYSFDIIGSRLIGLYDVASSADFPGFGIIVICATFHWFWKMSSSIPISGSSSSILPIILSYPGDFFGYYLLIIINLTSVFGKVWLVILIVLERLQITVFKFLRPPRFQHG